MRRGSVPVGPMINRVNAKTTTYDIDRRVDEGVGGYEYAESVTEADLYLYDPTLTRSVVDEGERTDGSLEGVCLPDEDIEVYDRVNYGQGRYEVVHPINGVPDEHNPSLLVLTLERVDESDSDFQI